LTELLTAPDFPAAVCNALRSVGEAAQVHRVKVILAQAEPESEPFHELRYEWWADHLQSQASQGLTRFRDRDVEQDYLRPLRAGDSIWKLIDDVGPPLHEPFARVGMKSMGVVPIGGPGNYAGLIAFDDCVNRRQFSSDEIYAMTIAANAIGAAIRRRQLEDRAAEHARSLARTNFALQATIDVLGEEGNLDRVVPRVLGIVAETFSSTSCAVFENDPSGLIWLKYWNVDGSTLAPDELMKLDPAKFGLVRRLAEGFGAPDEYLGMPTSVPGTAVLDHVRGTAVPEFDKFAVGTGWELELNIGVGAGGIRATTLCIYRRKANPFTPPEIALAESLATQLGLAVQFARLAEQARETAVIREQAAAAERRAAELSRAHEAMQATIDALGEIRDLDQFVPAALRVAAKAFGAEQSLFYTHPAGEPIRLRYWLQGGAVLSPSEILTLEDLDTSVVRTLVEGFEVPENHLSTPVRRRYRASVLDHRAGSAVPEFDRFCCAHRMEVELNVPLVIGEIAEGAMLFFRRAGETFSPGEIALAEALGKQMALAMQASRVAETAKVAAISAERETAAERRARASARSSKALQATIEALGDAMDLDQIFPRVLAIAAEVFEAAGCSAFEHSPSGTAWLRYWYMEGKTYTPAELLRLDPEKFGLVSRLAAGFDVPDDYLGLRPQATGTAVLDHVRGTSMPEFDRFAVSFGGELELNVGVGAAGVRSSTLVIYSRRTEPFAPEEIALAESLATQLGLAIQFARLAAEAKQAAIAREREQAALSRAEGLARISEANRATLARLAGQPNIDAFLGHILAIAAEQFGASGGGVWLQSPGRGPRLALTLEDGRVLPGDEGDHPGAGAGSDSALDDTPAMLRGEIVVYGPDQIHTQPHLAPYRDWLVRKGVRTIALAPMFLGDSYRGALSLRFTEDRRLNQEERELAQSLANQAVLALELTRLAEEAKRTAVIREREAAAQDRAAELAKANRALKTAVDSLAAAGSGPLLLQGIVGVLRESMDAVSVVLAVCDTQLLAAIGNENPSLGAEAAEPGLAEYLKPGKPEFAALSRCGVLSPEAEEFFAAQGVAGQLTVPLILGTALIGALRIRLRKDQPPAREQIELAQSLAHQATLAMRLTELAIEAQHEAAEKAKSEERAALARELHDTLLQSFTGITLQLRALARRYVAEDSSRALLADIERQATDSVQEARRAVGGLRNTDGIGIAAALHGFVETQRTETSDRERPVEYQFTQTGEPWPVPAAVALDLLRMSREALRNAARHSGASKIRIALTFGPGSLRIVLADNGCGFDPEAVQSKPANFGISGMKERARHIHAALRISSGPDAGTSIMIEYPATGEVRV
jgi:signal transduction histidine kinase